MGKVIRKIEVFILFLICLFYYLIHGKANKKPKQIKKFLVVQMAKLGDMVCTTPVFHAIKTQDSSNQVFVLTSKTNKNLLEYNMDVDRVFVYHKKRLWSLIKELRKENFDYTCVIDCNFVGLAILYLSGVGFIAAPVLREKENNPYLCSYYSILQKLVAVPFSYHFQEYVPLTRLRSLEEAGIFSQNPSKHLGFSDGARDKIRRFFGSMGINKHKDILVAVHVGAGNKVKLWNPEKWARFMDKISEEQGVRVLLTGSKFDEKEIKAVRALLKTDNIINAFDFNIDEFKAFLSLVDIFIACDSGPIYIAEAFDKYIIDITGPFNGKEQAPHPPYYPKGRMVFKDELFCCPCSFVMNSVKTCRFGTGQCLEEINVEDLLSVFENVLEEVKNKKNE